MSAFGGTFASKYGIAFSELDFKKSIRELEGSFITVSKRRFGSGLIVSFHNPSVEDFLLNYLNNNRDVVSDILEAAPFFNQFFKVFALAGSVPGGMYMHKVRGRLVVDGHIKELILNRSTNEINELGISELQSIEIPRKQTEGRFSRLSTLLNETRGLDDPRLREFAELEFERLHSS